MIKINSVNKHRLPIIASTIVYVDEKGAYVGKQQAMAGASGRITHSVGRYFVAVLAPDRTVTVACKVESHSVSKRVYNMSVPGLCGTFLSTSVCCLVAPGSRAPILGPCTTSHGVRDLLLVNGFSDANHQVRSSLWCAADVVIRRGHVQVTRSSACESWSSCRSAQRRSAMHWRTEPPRSRPPVRRCPRWSSRRCGTGPEAV